MYLWFNFQTDEIFHTAQLQEMNTTFDKALKEGKVEVRQKVKKTNQIKTDLVAVCLVEIGGRGMHKMGII